jgi:hypothetical protein
MNAYICPIDEGDSDRHLYMWRVYVEGRNGFELFHTEQAAIDYCARMGYTVKD